MTTGMYFCVPPMTWVRICNPPAWDETIFEIAAVTCAVAPPLVVPMPTVCADALAVANARMAPMAKVFVSRVMLSLKISNWGLILISRQRL